VSFAEVTNDETEGNSIATSNLIKVYRNFRAVNALTINVNSGDIFGFLGPNGAGKTTTIRMLCGLLSPSAGTAKVAGFDIVKDSIKIRRIIGLVPESSGFYNWMNAPEYLLHLAALYKIKPDFTGKIVNDLLEKVGLANKAFAPIGYYSRGMKQRLGLARALINNPKIIFLDEPTLGLDPKGQQDIQKILLELNREKGVTIFLSSHTLSEVSSLCNRVAIVSRGRLVAQGTIDELRELAGSSRGLILVRILNSPSAQKDLSALPFKLESTTTENRLINITISQISESANDIIDKFEDAGLQIYEIRRLDMSLEDVFFKLTETKHQQQHQQQQQQPQREFNNNHRRSHSLLEEQQQQKSDGERHNA
jgi:ABC-2 type transport system ATP-binding protein